MACKMEKGDSRTFDQPRNMGTCTSAGASRFGTFIKGILILNSNNNDDDDDNKDNKK